MRQMGFTERWEKLNQPTFTTFRLPRRDTDWQLGERVRVVYRPRGKNRELLCEADIIRIEQLEIHQITHNEAVEDGFDDVNEMKNWLHKVHGDRLSHELLHKLTLCKVDRSA